MFPVVNIVDDRLQHLPLFPAGILKFIDQIVFQTGVQTVIDIITPFVAVVGQQPRQVLESHPAFFQHLPAIKPGIALQQLLHALRPPAGLIEQNVTAMSEQRFNRLAQFRRIEIFLGEAFRLGPAG